MRSSIAEGRCVYLASVFDPLSARIAEDLGFEAGMFAGSIASFAVLGAPDIAMLTLADADHGYGNPLKVKRTVEELETAREPYGSCFAQTNEASDTARRLREMVEEFSQRRFGWRQIRYGGLDRKTATRHICGCKGPIAAKAASRGIARCRP